MTWAFRVADVADILLVAFLLYIFLWWLRRQLSASALHGLGVVTLFLLSLYLPARIFEMYMMEQISQLLVVFALLATVVIFQSDLRRLIYSAGARLFGQSPVSQPGESSPVDLIVESASNLAETATGALIAIRGQDPWDHHIHGGVELNGVVSSPLLYSLFDPQTEGHDGAVLLNGKRVTAFGAHLPLAESLPHASQYGGTRHAAALGLAELCDAFVIVVSEERGTISVAADGEIQTVESAPELKEKLSAFWEMSYGSPPASDRRWWSRRSLQTAALSLGISVVLWFTVAYNPEIVYRSFDVPIEYHDVPENWALEEGASTTRITLSGPEQTFRMIEPEELTVAFSLKKPKEGLNELTVEGANLDVPEKLIVTSAEPRTINVRTYPLEQKTLPVSVRTEGRLPDSLQLVHLQPTPDSVTVLLPKGSTRRELGTEPVVLDSIQGETTLERALTQVDDVRFADQSAAQAVSVHVAVQTTTARPDE